MNHLSKLIIVLILATLVSHAENTSEKKCCAPVVTTDFGKLKQLIGKWEAMSKMSGKNQKVFVNYKLTSGGTALVETLFPGTPHEMVSVYTADGGDLMMTHYCMLGNQPRLKVEESDQPNQMKFEFDGGTGIKSSKDPHMHALTITFIDPDHFRQEWAFFDGGKQKSVETLNFARAK